MVRARESGCLSDGRPNPVSDYPVESIGLPVRFPVDLHQHAAAGGPPVDTDRRCHPGTSTAKMPPPMEHSTPLAIATILAIILGPILALWMQRVSDRRRDRRNRKLVIFKELMATRATRLNPRHVDALNAIEVEFSGGAKDDKRVLDAWRFYLDHLCGNPGQDALRWADRGTELLIDLLYEMSRVLNYDFSKVTLKNNTYMPTAHGELELDQQLLRKYLVEMMEGKRALLAGIYTGEKPLEVRMADERPGTLHEPPTARTHEPPPLRRPDGADV